MKFISDIFKQLDEHLATPANVIVDQLKDLEKRAKNAGIKDIKIKSVKQIRAELAEHERQNNGKKES